jgi:hypothetical protein
MACLHLRIVQVATDDAAAVTPPEPTPSVNADLRRILSGQRRRRGGAGIARSYFAVSRVGAV